MMLYVFAFVGALVLGVLAGWWLYVHLSVLLFRAELDRVLP